MDGLMLPIWVIIGWGVVLGQGLILVLTGAPLGWLGVSTLVLMGTFSLIVARSYYGWRWPLKPQPAESESES